MDFKTLMSSIFGFTAPTYYSWKKEERPIIALLEKYFTKEELEEFLGTGKIQKFEHVNSYLHSLKLKCHDVYNKIEKLEIKHKYPDVSYESKSIFISPNFYTWYVIPFFKKHKADIKSFELENFKINFFNLALLDPFELRSNGIKEPLVTFQILTILDELSSPELHYFFNNFETIEV